MSQLKAKIQEDLKQAMLGKESEKVSVLRMLKAAIMNFEVSGSKKEATDEDLMKIIKQEVKKRKDSAEQFKNGDRMEMAAQEEREEVMLKKYLPEEMSEEVVTEIVKKVIADTGATSKADFGKVMGMAMAQTKGQADGTLVKQIVENNLQ